MSEQTEPAGLEWARVVDVNSSDPDAIEAAMAKSRNGLQGWRAPSGWPIGGRIAWVVDRR